MPYHHKVPLQGQEQFVLRETLVSVHVPRKEHGLLQGFNDVPYLAPLVFPNRGVPRIWCPIHLKPKAPTTLCHAYFSPIQLVAALHRRGPLVTRFPSHLLVFCAMPRAHLAFLKRLGRPLLLQVRVNLQAEVDGDCGGAGGRLEGA